TMRLPRKRSRRSWSAKPATRESSRSGAHSACSEPHPAAKAPGCWSTSRSNSTESRLVMQRNVGPYSAAVGAALLVLVATGVAAQVPSAPRELGMAGAYVGVARGYEAVFMAPGN